MENYYQFPGWVLPYLHNILRFSIQLGAFLCLTSILMTTPFGRKVGVYLSHLAQEILGPKVGLMIYQKFIILQFVSILYQFHFDFRCNWPLILTKLLIPLGPFLSRDEPSYQEFGEVAPTHQIHNSCFIV